jgi:hypothetical protein
MNESEWLLCGDPKPMPEFLAGRVSERKVSVLACACVAFGGF